MADEVDVGSIADFSFRENRGHGYIMRNRRCFGERESGGRRRLIGIFTPFVE